MKKPYVLMLLVFGFLCLVTAKNAHANIESGTITESRAVEIALSEVKGTLVAIEYEKNAIEVLISSKEYGLVEVYVDDNTGGILMMENALTEFAPNESH